jgi:cell division septation protein DedD
MAPGKSKSKKKGFGVTFELSLPGLMGLGVVCFCIFLWMFLLGIWSGQTLFPSGKYRPAAIGKAAPDTLTAIAKKKAVSEDKAVAAPVIAGKKELTAEAGKRIVARKTRPEPKPEEDPAFFAIQVGAFKDGKLAVKEVETWKNKGYDSFSRPPTGDDDNFNRVYVGRFESPEKARDQVAIIGRKEKIKPFVVLVSGE